MNNTQMFFDAAHRMLDVAQDHLQEQNLVPIAFICMTPGGTAKNAMSVIWPHDFPKTYRQVVLKELLDDYVDNAISTHTLTERPHS